MAERACQKCGVTVPEGQAHACSGGGTSSARAEALIGTVLEGRYEVTGILGKGGMGVVYEATQKSIRRPVAVKMLHQRLARDPEFFERFRREAALASRLRHPNIISVQDFGRAPDGRCFYVMELLFGESLRSLVRKEGPLSVLRAANIVEHIAKALGHAHREGVVHRDLKPHNVMVQPLDGSDYVKVLDFGLSKAIGPKEWDELTGHGQVVGTPQYMAPEQAAGRRVDERSDLHALGAVLYFCLTGVPPFGAATIEKAREAGRHPPPSAASRRPGGGVPEELELFLRRALAPDPSARFPDTDAFIRELRLAVAGVAEVAAAHTGTDSEDETVLTRAQRPSRPAGARPRWPERLATALQHFATRMRVRFTRSWRGLRRSRRLSPQWLALALLPVLLFFLGAGLVFSARSKLLPEHEAPRPTKVPPDPGR